MPIVKHIPIHTTPLLSIEYIVNGDKTDEMKYVTGINCPTNANEANEFFRRSFETCTGERFYKKILDEKKGKEKIRLHHYVQSFAPDENITPEEAHKIGMEWAARMFGDKFQVIVSTHIDKNHIHNHFAVSSYSLDGKKWNDNYTTLKQCRQVSDEIAKEHGIQIIEKPKHKNTMKYNEWLACQNGTSWKAKLIDKIDELILRSDVTSIDDLADKLREEQYQVRLGKYMTIKLSSMERGVRTIRLGDGYDLPELAYRIEHKEREISKAAISKLSGEAKVYALYMRQLQIQVFHKKSKKVAYTDLTKAVNLLNYLSDNNITSVEQFENEVNKADEKYKDSVEKQKSISDEIAKEQNADKRKLLENEKTAIDEKVKMLKDEREKVAALYKTYLRQRSENLYDKIVEEANYEQEQLNKANNVDEERENSNIKSAYVK